MNNRHAPTKLSRVNHVTRYAPTSQRYVLVAHTDEVIRELIANALQDEGYVVEMVGNGRDALLLIVWRRPAVILVDDHLPDWNGWSLARLQQAIPAPRAPVILLTCLACASGNVEFRSTSVRNRTWCTPRQGAESVAAVLAQPFDLNDLSATVSRHACKGDAEAAIQPLCQPS